MLKLCSRILRCEYYVTEKMEQHPGYKKETKFTSKCTANEIIKKIEHAAKPLGFDVHKKNYKEMLTTIPET
ncbi:hypothetical protein ACS0TY_023891 [Phlomoides rotata]